MDDGGVVGKDAGRALQHGQRRQGLEIGRRAGQFVISAARKAWCAAAVGLRATGAWRALAAAQGAGAALAAASSQAWALWRARASWPASFLPGRPFSSRVCSFSPWPGTLVKAAFKRQGWTRDLPMAGSLLEAVPWTVRRCRTSRSRAACAPFMPGCWRKPQGRHAWAALALLCLRRSVILSHPAGCDAAADDAGGPPPRLPAGGLVRLLVGDGRHAGLCHRRAVLEHGWACG